MTTFDLLGTGSLQLIIGWESGKVNTYNRFNYLFRIKIRNNFVPRLTSETLLLAKVSLNCN